MMTTKTACVAAEKTTTEPHTTYRSAYSSAVVTLCATCHARGEYPVADEVESYLAADPDCCDGCGAVYRQMAP